MIKALIQHTTRRRAMLLAATTLSLTCADITKADTVTVSGTTVGGPTLSRPETSGLPNYPKSAVYRADAAPYAVDAFWVDRSGHFDIYSTPTGGWDNFFALYQGSFDPSQPLQNLVFFNDDVFVNGRQAAGNTSTFDAQAGVQYLAVTTGKLGASGAYNLLLSSQGTVHDGLIPAAPEPGEWAMIIVGTGIVGVWSRRQPRDRSVADRPDRG